jgi:hypothetical protein
MVIRERMRIDKDEESCIFDRSWKRHSGDGVGENDLGQCRPDYREAFSR